MCHLTASQPAVSNGEIVDYLLRAWRSDAGDEHVQERVRNGDKIRYYWQEVKNVLGTGTRVEIEKREMIGSWPKGGEKTN